MCIRDRFRTTLLTEVLPGVTVTVMNVLWLRFTVDGLAKAMPVGGAVAE